MPERTAESPETAEAVPAAPAAARVPLAAGSLDAMALQRAIGNRATRRLLRQVRLLQRETVQTGFQWPTDQQTLNSPFALKVLVDWLRMYPVSLLDPEKYENAYYPSRVEPDPLGCMWKGSATNGRAVADAFMKESSTAGMSFRREDVVATIRDQLKDLKRARLDDIIFPLPRSDQKVAGAPWDPFPWQAYDGDADQFTDGSPDPMKGAAGPIVDWLDWYEFDAVAGNSNDADACLLDIEGKPAGARVMGVVRLYHNDAVKAGYLGVDHDAVEAFVRKDLATRKQHKQQGVTQREQHWDGRGIRDDRRAQAFGPPPKVPAKTPDDKDPNFQVQFQINNTSHTPVRGGATTTDPPNAQITLQQVIFRLPAGPGEVQISLQGSASFELSRGAGSLPRLVASKLTSVQGAAQAAWAVDLFKDLLQVQAFVQVVGGASFAAGTDPVTGSLKMNPAPMYQGAAGGQIVFIVPGTDKRLQIFYQHQESRSGGGPGGATNDRQDSFGISYAPPIPGFN